MRDIDEIKQKLDIVTFINERVPLKKAGRNFIARCPFHQEKSPSFYVSVDRQIWHCFGACNMGGDIFTFVMKWENIEFFEALSELANKAGVTLSTQVTSDQSWQHTQRLLEIHHLSSEYYHFLLQKHTVGNEAREYLRKRAINEKIITTFMLGYAPSSWHNLLNYLTRKGYQTSEIEEAGLIIRSEKGYYDRFRGRIIFPLKNHRGQIVGFSGRILDSTDKEAKYINSPETPLYHKGRMLYGLDVTQQAIRKSGFALICEGEFDVLSSFQAGISNIVAIKGTALTEDQLKLLKRYTDEIRLALDMDFAGDAASRKSIELCSRLDVNTRVIQIPSGKDLDEGVREEEHLVKKAVAEAIPVYDFILLSATKRHPSDGPFDKKAIADEVVPFFARIINPILKNHYAKKLAEALGVTEESVLEQFGEELKREHLVRPQQASSPEQTVRKPREELLEEHLTALLIQNSQHMKNLQFLPSSLTIEDIRSPSIQRILSILIKQEGEKIDDILPAELSETYNRLYLLDLGALVGNEKAFKKELEKTQNELEKLKLRRKLVVLTTKSDGENAHTSDSMRAISQRLKELGEKS